MTHRAFAPTAAAVAVCCLIPGTASASSTASKVYKKAIGSVVVVFTDEGLGSGFSYLKPGTFLTNAHVVSGYEEVGLKTLDGKTATAKVLKVDENRDVALLDSDLKLPPLDPPSRKPATGDDAFAIGAPKGAEGTFSDGIISQAIRTVRGLPWIQTNVAINHGNSGGPLMNDQAQVIGLNTWIANDTEDQRAEGMAFAVPIDSAETTLGLKRAADGGRDGEGGNSQQGGGGKPDSPKQPGNAGSGYIKVALVAMGLSIVLGGIALLVFFLRKASRRRSPGRPGPQPEADVVLRRRVDVQLRRNPDSDPDPPSRGRDVW